jgi:hypothetical protein
MARLPAVLKKTNLKEFQKLYSCTVCISIQYRKKLPVASFF